MAVLPVDRIARGVCKSFELAQRFSQHRGRAIADLEIIIECAAAVDLANQIQFVPW
jgi:hypothetical protein